MYPLNSDFNITTHPFGGLTVEGGGLYLCIKAEAAPLLYQGQLRGYRTTHITRECVLNLEEGILRPKDWLIDLGQFFGNARGLIEITDHTVNMRDGLTSMRGHPISDCTVYQAGEKHLLRVNPE